MATVNALNIKLPSILPNKLYTPIIKNKEVINKRLYTLNINNEEKIDLSQQIPIPELEEFDTPIFIPEPELSPFDIPLYIPNPKNNKVDKFLIIPNLNSEEVDPSISIPELPLDSIDIPLFTPKKLKTPWIPKYAYAIPLKRGAEELKEIFTGAFEVNPINSWSLDLSYDGRTNEDYRGLGDDWVKKWKEIEKQYTRNSSNLWLITIPYNVELPKNSEGKVIKLSYKIPKVKIPKKYVYKRPYMAYRNVGGSWLWKNTKIMPDPNFKVPEPPSSMGWDGKAWEMRGEQFIKDWKELWSAENWANIGKEVATDFISSIGASMLTFGGYDIGGSGTEKTGGYKIYYPERWPHTSPINNKKEVIPHIFNYTPKESRLKDNWNPGIQTKFNFVDHSPHPINMINAIGPDFLKHKFDAYIIFYNEFGITTPINLDKEKWMSPFQKFIFNHKGFAVRFGTINIPTVSQDNFAINWLETQILKPKTVLNTENKASFSFRIDQNLFWLDFIDKLSSHNNTIDSLILEKTPESQDEKYKNYFFNETIDANTWKEAIHYISNSFQNDIKIGLVIKMVHLSDYINTNTQERVLPYFIFEDIKILGSSTSITYSRESNEIYNATINFIFKFLSEIYIPTNKEEGAYEYTTNSQVKNSEIWSNYIGHSLYYKEFFKKPPTIYTYEQILGVE
jgi:hypothetical protein